MKDKFRDSLLKEAIRIGDDILKKAKKNQHGIYWETLTSQEEGGEYKTKLYVTDNIYSGCAGIVLYLIALYKKTNDVKYYSAVKAAADWLIDYCEKNETDYYAFFTGRLGVAYTLIKCSELLNDSFYREKGLEIANDCPKFLKSERPIDDLINGYSGTLLGLLHLHAMTKEDRLVNHISAFANALIERANLGVKGLYWDRSYQQVRGLCGFSHGAAGIGAVFLELGKYFDNKAFYLIAEQAFTYETQYFDEERGNWPDFRKGFYTRKDQEEAEEAYRKNNIEYFTLGSDMNAWCHGAAGIGLSRLRAFDILKNESYKKHAEQAINKTVVTDVSNTYPTRTFTLCHGGGGNADLFIEAYLQFGKKEHLDYAYTIAEKALNTIEQGKTYQAGLAYAREEDLSMFMGNAGIGYFLLRLLDPESTPSVEFPRVVKHYAGTKIFKENVVLHYSVSDINKILLKKVFNKTYLTAKYFAENDTATFVDNIAEFNKSTFPLFIKKLCRNIDPTNADKLADILQLEEAKMNMEDQTKSAALLYTKQLILVKDIEELLKKTDEELQGTKLKLDKDLGLINTKYDWTTVAESNPLPAMQEEESLTLLLLTYNGVAEWKVSSLVEGIIDTLRQKSKTLNEILSEVFSMFDAPKNAHEAKMINDSILSQAKELIKYGIIQQVAN